MNLIPVGIIVFAVAVVLVMLFYFKNKLHKTAEAMKKDLTTTTIGVADSMEHFKRELAGKLKSFKAGIKQYTKHKLASPQQICKARSKAGKKKIVKAQDS